VLQACSAPASEVTKGVTTDARRQPEQIPSTDVDHEIVAALARIVMAQAERKLHAKVGLGRLPTRRRPMVEQHVWKPEQARAVDDVERRPAQTRKEEVVVPVALEAP